jgi:LCP family protein required for cell wall assembly
MSARLPGPDDARPIPRGGAAVGALPPQSDAADDAMDDVYVVDVRGSRRGFGRGRGAGKASGMSTGAGAGNGAERGSATGGATPSATRRVPFLRIVAVVLALWLAFMVATPLHAWSTVTKVDASPSGQRPVDTAGFNYLLVGSDSRAGLTAAQRREYSTGTAAGRRTDSIILVHVPQSGGKPALISIPRDSFVPIPGHGSNKINAAFSFGGPNLLVQTIEQVSGLHIDGYVEIGFAGFASVVDSVGGVNICVPFHMDDKKAGINLQKGCQVLDGKNALGFVRARYSDPRGDIGRAQRQRQFLAAIMKKALTPSTILLPTRYWGFSHAAAQGLIVGQDTTMSDATRVLMAMRSVSNGSGLSLVVPLQSVDYQTSAGSSVKWDTARAKALFTLLREDKPLEAPPAGTDGKPSGG